MEHIKSSFQRQREASYNNINRSYEQRLQNLKTLKSLIEYEEPRILEALKDDLGKCEFEGAISETSFLLVELKHTLKKLKKWMKPKRVKSPWLQFPARSYIRPEPLGTVLIISPWNYPFQLLISPLIGALAAGNTAILKPSEVAPATSKLIAELIPKYFPKELVDVVEGAIPETQALLDLPFNHIFYTGNGHVGRIVMEKASQHLTPVTLELGGKSPCFIYGKNDLSLVAKRLVWGKFFNAGQTCVAPDYVLLPSATKKEIIPEIQKALSEFYPQGPKDSPDYGKIINERHFERLEGYLEGCSVLIGGEKDKGNRFLAPTIVEAEDQAKVMQEEIFGPILPLVAIDSFEEAIEFVRSRPHPLAAYAFSKDTTLLDKLVYQVTAGGFCLNDSIVHLTSESLPFGGVGESGIGAYHGKKSFDIFSHHKSVMKRGWFDLPLRYPPYKGKLSLIKKLLKWLG